MMDFSLIFQKNKFSFSYQISKTVLKMKNLIKKVEPYKDYKYLV